MKIGLVLGAGGVVGTSWLVGALEGLEDATGWSACDADLIVGTSAGAAVGSLLADGIRPAHMHQYIAGGTLDEFDEIERHRAALAARPEGSTLKLHRGLPSIGPGSLRMAAATLRRPWRHPAMTLLAGWLPRGVVSTAPISDLVRSFTGNRWPERAPFWCVAADYLDGRRVAFGRPGAPEAAVADAVAASCSIPGFYHPVSIGRRAYVDGGICSPSNADLLADPALKLDLVICLNPMSAAGAIGGGSIGDRVGALMRRAARGRLRRELTKLDAAAVQTLVVEPTETDLAGMGWNLMARRSRIEVMETAVRTTARAVRDLRYGEGALPTPRRGTAPRRPAAAREAASAKLREAA
jgi:NTE family protein